MKKTIAGIILFTWILLGIVFSAYYYHKTTSLTAETIQNQIVEIQHNARNTNEVLDRLPAIFSQAPATSVILILNQKSKLLGSLYEPSRITMPEYEQILKTYKTMELRDFFYMHLPFISGYSIWVIGKKNLAVSQLFRFTFENNSKLILIPITYIFTLLILLMILLVDPAENRKPVDVKKDQKKEPIKTSEQISDPKKSKAHKIISNDRYLANKILLLMDTIEKNFSTNSIAFYSRESGKWNHVLEKSGNLTIRGDAAVENLPREILNLSDSTWREPLLSSDKRLLFIPLHYRNLLFGLIRLQFTGLATDLDNNLLDRLILLCTRYSDSLFMQRIYDKAVADPETDFYNYPYFYFMVKEKLASSQNFAVVVFEISELNRISPETTRLWAQELLIELQDAQLQPVVSARLDRAKFVLLYEIRQENAEKVSGKVDLKELDTVPRVIKQVTHKNFKNMADLTGGFFLRPTSMEDADSFMQRLDYLLVNSTFSAYPSDFSGKFSMENQKTAV